MSIISKDRDANTKAWLEVLFKAHEAGLNGIRNHPITAFRRKAYSQLQEERFPTRKDEDWKYTNVGPIIKSSYQQGEETAIDTALLDEFLFEGLEVVKVVLVNGILHAENGLAKIGLMTILEGAFTAATVLISFGAVFGTMNPLQLLVMALIESPIVVLNAHMGYKIYGVIDIGKYFPIFF